MEEVLKLRVMYGKVPLWESLYRNFIVIICLILLGISAKYGSRNYRNLQKEAEHTGKDTYTEMVSEKGLDILSVLGEKDIELSAIGKMNLPERPKPLSFGAEEESALREPKRTEENRIVPEAIKVTEEPVAEEGITAEENLIVPESDVADNIKVVPVADDTAGGTEKPEDTDPVMNISVTVYGNGGMSEVTELSCERDAFTADMLSFPKRLGKLFDGWYIDAECSIPFAGIEEKAESLVLYAGWKEFPGFPANDSGHIIGCTDAGLAADGFLRIPDYGECTGIERGAFDSIRDFVFEIYIPANITYIENGALDSLSNLMYIEAAAGNPSYYSENGILYNRDGTIAAYPAGWDFVSSDRDLDI